MNFGTFRKYHGLGNDYLIPLEEDRCAPEEIVADTVRLVCDVHYGLGSDGILYGPYMPSSPFFQRLGCPEALCAFRILNPDGSEAEKSGNGVRIFARYLHDCGLVKTGVPFTLATLGGPIRCTVIDPRDAIRAEMGHVSFDSAAIPVAGPQRDVVDEEITADDGRVFRHCAVTVGNPHCVLLLDEPPTEALARRYGPHFEKAARFPNRTNVQFACRKSDHELLVEIYERGAGYTLASGTSACAAAASAVRVGWCRSPVRVLMPGGTLEIHLDEAWSAMQCGPVRRVYEATLETEEP